MKLTTQDKIKIQVQFSEFFEDKTPLFSVLIKNTEGNFEIITKPYK
jgi:hypothetical protein